MSYFKKMYIAAEIVNNHIIPDTNLHFYSEGEAENYLKNVLKNHASKMFLIIPLCKMCSGNQDDYNDYIKMKERITNKYLNQ